MQYSWAHHHADDQGPLLLQLQAVSGSLRSFLGPEPSAKTVVDTASDSRCVIASRPEPFLLAASTEPTATALLLNALDQQAQYVGCGGRWLAVLTGVLAGSMRSLLAEGYPPALLTRALQAATEEAIEACHQCCIPVHHFTQPSEQQQQQHTAGQPLKTESPEHTTMPAQATIALRSAPSRAGIHGGQYDNGRGRNGIGSGGAGGNADEDEFGWFDDAPVLPTPKYTTTSIAASTSAATWSHSPVASTGNTPACNDQRPASLAVTGQQDQPTSSLPAGLTQMPGHAASSAISCPHITGCLLAGSCSSGHSSQASDAASEGRDSDGRLDVGGADDVAWFFAPGELAAEMRALRDERARLKATQSAFCRMLGASDRDHRLENAAQLTAAAASSSVLYSSRETLSQPAIVAGSLAIQNVHSAVQRQDPALHPVSAATVASGAWPVTGLNSSASKAAALQLRPALRMLVHSIAPGLAHGPAQAMQLAMDALEPLIAHAAITGRLLNTPAHITSSTVSSEQQDIIQALSAAASRVSWQRQVLLHEMLGPPQHSSTVVPGVCVPLHLLSPEQARLASSFLSHRDTHTASSALRGGGEIRTGHGMEGDVKQGGVRQVLLLEGSLQPDHASISRAAVTDASQLQRATLQAQQEAYAVRIAAELGLLLDGSCQSSQPVTIKSNSEESATRSDMPAQRATAFASSVVLSSGYVPDWLSCHLAECGMLLLGSLGTPTLRALAAQAGVEPWPTWGCYLLPPAGVVQGSNATASPCALLATAVPAAEGCNPGATGTHTRTLTQTPAGAGLAGAGSFVAGAVHQEAMLARQEPFALLPHQPSMRGIAQMHVSLHAAGYEVNEASACSSVKGPRRHAGPATAVNGTLLRILPVTSVSHAAMVADSAWTQTQACSTGSSGKDQVHAYGWGLRTDPTQLDLEVQSSTSNPSPFVTLLLCSPLRMQGQALQGMVHACFHRVLACLTHGSVLPGGGAWELAVAACMQTAADTDMANVHSTHPAAESTGCGLCPLAWGQQSDAYACLHAVRHAVAAALHDMVLIIQQALGHTYSQACEQVAKAEALLVHHASLRTDSSPVMFEMDGLLVASAALSGSTESQYAGSKSDAGLVDGSPISAVYDAFPARCAALQSAAKLVCMVLPVQAVTVNS